MYRCSFLVVCFLLISEFGHAQRTATTVVTNFNTAGSTFSFEVWSRKTNPGTGPEDTIRVGTSSFYFDYNSSALSTPSLSNINAKYTGDSTSADYAPMRVGIVGADSLGQGGKIAVTLFFTGLQTGLGDTLSTALPIGERMCTVNLQISDTSQPTNVQWDSVNSATTHSGEQPPDQDWAVENTFDSVAAPNVRASVKFFLEGPYNAGTLLMNKGLPLASHFDGTIPAEAVDSVNIEIRNAESASVATTRKFQPAWVLTDGSIRGFTDTTLSYVEFDTTAGDYYLVVRHRNHIAIMTAGTMVLAAAVPSAAYDFTTAQSSAFGSNSMKALAGSKFGLIAGDANSNGQIATSDINTIIRPALGQAGYRNADINLNGQVQNSDINTFTRPNLGRGTQVPSAPVTITEKEIEQ